MHKSVFFGLLLCVVASTSVTVSLYAGDDDLVGAGAGAGAGAGDVARFSKVIIEGETLGTDVLTRDCTLTVQEDKGLPLIQNYLRTALRQMGVKLKRKGKRGKPKSANTLYYEYAIGELDCEALFGADAYTKPVDHNTRIRLCIRLLMWIHIYQTSRKAGTSCNAFVTERVGSKAVDPFQLYTRMQGGDNSEQATLTHFIDPDEIAEDLVFLLLDTDYQSREVDDRRNALLAYCYPDIADMPLFNFMSDELKAALAEVPEEHHDMYYAALWYRDMGVLRSALAKIIKQYLGEKSTSSQLQELIIEQREVSRRENLPCTHMLVYPKELKDGTSYMASLENAHNAAWGQICPGGVPLFFIDREIQSAASKSLEEAITVLEVRRTKILADVANQLEEMVLLQAYRKNYVADIGFEIRPLNVAPGTVLKKDRRKKVLAERVAGKYHVPRKFMNSFLNGKKDIDDLASVIVQTCPKHELIHQETALQAERGAGLMRSYAVNGLLLAVFKKLQSFEVEGREDLFNALAQEAGVTDVTMRSPAPTKELAIVTREACKPTVTIEATEGTVSGVAYDMRKGTAEKRFEGRFEPGGRVRRTRRRRRHHDVYVS